MLALPFVSFASSARSASASTSRALPPPTSTSTHHPRRKPSTTHVSWAPYHKQLNAPSSSHPVRLPRFRRTRTIAALVGMSLLVAFVYLCATAEMALMGSAPLATTARVMRSGGAMGRSMQMQKAAATGRLPNLGSVGTAPRAITKPLRSSPLPSSAKAAASITLTPQEELAALVTYLTSHDTHGLPVDINPAVPLVPDTILDVSLPLNDKRRAKMLAEVSQETWDRWPVVVIGATKATAKARTLLKHESLFGQAQHGVAFIETNSRPDARILTAVLERLTSISASSPIVLIGGLPYSLAEFEEIYSDGWLQQLMTQAGATLGEEQRKREAKEKRAAIAMRKIQLNLGEDDY